MDMPKPSFLRKPSIPDFLLPKANLSNYKVPGRLMTLKDLRKYHKTHAFSSFSPVLSQFTDFSRLLDTKRNEKGKLKGRSGLYSVNLVRFPANSREKKHVEGNIGGITGHKVPISPNRVIIQISSKLPQQYRLKKSLSQSQVLLTPSKLSSPSYLVAYLSALTSSHAAGWSS